MTNILGTLKALNASNNNENTRGLSTNSTTTQQVAPQMQNNAILGQQQVVTQMQNNVNLGQQQVTPQMQNNAILGQQQVAPQMQNNANLGQQQVAPQMQNNAILGQQQVAPQMQNNVTTNLTAKNAAEPASTGKATSNKTAKSSTKEKKGSSAKKEESSVYKYRREIPMPVKFCGITKFTMELEMDLHGMDEFQYMKDKLAELGVREAKLPNFIIDEQDTYFRLIKVAREPKHFQTKG